MALFERLYTQGNTIVLVTHEHDIALHAHRVIHVRDGKVEKRRTHPLKSRGDRLLCPKAPFLRRRGQSCLSPLPNGKRPRTLQTFPAFFCCSSQPLAARASSLRHNLHRQHHEHRLGRGPCPNRPTTTFCPSLMSTSVRIPRSV